jgi:phospholipid N-methyltransferase
LNQAKQNLSFVGQWLKKPLQTGAIMPSGKELAALIVRDVVSEQGRVIEFGGGTGAFTKALLDHGVPADQLEVVELNPDFAKNLRKRFPAVRIIETNAAELEGEMLGPQASYAFVVSGLPLLSIPKPIREAILAQAFRLLRPEGAMFQFSYSPRCPVSKAVLTGHGLVAHKIGACPKNIPPAYVFRIERG